MKNNLKYILFFLVVFLVGFGFLFLACLSSQASLRDHGNTYYYLWHEFKTGILPGAILGFVAYKISLKFVKKWSLVLVALNVAALFLVFLPKIGSRAFGASRWVNIAGFNFQPAEFLKISAILYLSAWVASKLPDTEGKDWKSVTKNGYYYVINILTPFAVFLGLIAIALVFQKDASTLGIITLTLLAIYFSARTPLWHTFLIMGLGAASLVVLIKLEPYRFDRLLIFLHPLLDPQGKAWQSIQSVISLGSGGVFGKGLGMSTQKFDFLPQAMTDSIFAIIGEELGIVGCLALIACFIMFFWLGIQISKNSNDKFSKMTAVGVSVWITLQAFINMSSVIGLFPLAGIPLPFFSYGGSHLVVELIGVGLLLNISKTKQI